MNPVMSLTRLPVVASISFPKICYSYVLRANRFRRHQRSLHSYAALSCQTKLNVNETQRAQTNSPSIQNKTTTTTSPPVSLPPSSLKSLKPSPSTSQKPEENSENSSPSPSLAASTDDEARGSGGNEMPPKSNPQKSKLSREAVRENVRGYVFTRYIDYVKNYDKVLEKNFPGAFKLYRVFFDGVRDFYSDMKHYLKIWRIANNSPEGLRALNRKELELFMQMPRDMVRVAPALIGTSLPMIGYAFFPLVFMYPRRFLTSHFWTLQQRCEFQQMQLEERFSHNRAVLRSLQSKLKSLSEKDKFNEISKILGLIGSGFHPTVEAILDVKDIFTMSPFSFDSLSGKHIKQLIGMHGLSGGLSKRFRLREHAILVHHMDLAIRREGGAHNVPLDSIQKCCAIRGLNPANMTKDDMVAFLKDWIKISSSIQEEHISLFLHLPILLAYNHPNNWKLVYSLTNQTSNTNASNNASV